MKCFNKMFSGFVLGVLGFALAVATVWVEPAQAQYDPNAMPKSNNLRSLIVNSWSNLGQSGGNQEWGRGNKRNAYPHNGTGAGSFGAVLSQFTSNQKSQMYNDYKTSGGEGIWLLNADKGSVSVTGPRGTPWLGENLEPLPYDPVGKAEENWGVPNPLASNATELAPIWDEGFSATLSNYWPGITKTDVGSYYEHDLSPGSTRPAQIANYGIGSYNLVDTTIPEETIIAQWVDKKIGLQITRRVYDWSNPDFDDFYIMDLTFKNTGDFDGDGVGESPGTINNLYIGFKNSAVMTAMGVVEEFGWNFYPSNARGVDDILWYTEAGGIPTLFQRMVPLQERICARYLGGTLTIPCPATMILATRSSRPLSLRTTTSCRLKVNHVHQAHFSLHPLPLQTMPASSRLTIGTKANMCSLQVLTNLSPFNTGLPGRTLTLMILHLPSPPRRI